MQEFQINNKQHLDVLLNSFTIDCWAMNCKRIYTYQNTESISNWGKVIGLSIDDLDINERLKKIWSKQLDEVFEGETLITEYYAESSDKYYKSIITPIKINNTVEGVIAATIDISDNKSIENDLLKKNEELKSLNTTLNVLLKKRETDKQALEKELVSSLQKQIIPLLDRLKQKVNNTEGQDIIKVIEQNLNQMQLSTPEYYKQILSHTEFMVFNFIQQGKTSKEIAKLLSISKSTVDTHRDKIRNKLGLKNKGQNLRDFILSI